jgi:hypothetical protein
MVWYGMVWYGMVWYGMVWYGRQHAAVPIPGRRYLQTRWGVRGCGKVPRPTGGSRTNAALQTSASRAWGRQSPTAGGNRRAGQASAAPRAAGRPGGKLQGARSRRGHTRGLPRARPQLPQGARLVQAGAVGGRPQARPGRAGAAPTPGHDQLPVEAGATGGAARRQAGRQAGRHDPGQGVRRGSEGSGAVVVRCGARVMSRRPPAEGHSRECGKERVESKPAGHALKPGQKPWQGAPGA